jgi:hypothetical protein
MSFGCLYLQRCFWFLTYLSKANELYNAIHKTIKFPFTRVCIMRQLIGLFGAPTAWLVQLTLSETLTAHACYPYQAPLPAPIWERLPLLLILISFSCLALALLSGFIALNTWRNLKQTSHENKNHRIETKADRTQFLIMLSLMSSFLFIVAVMFNSFALLIVPPCSSWF